MFIHYRTKGFILKKEDRGEADRIFTVFTQDFGKLELLARAERKIKSKLRSGLELFYLSDIEFIQGKTQKTVTDAVLIDDFKGIKHNLVKSNVCHRIAESVDGLVKFGERDENLWALLSETFAKVDNDSLKISTLGLALHYFLWNLFSILGYSPDLYLCLFCREKIDPENIRFSPQDGGLFCGQCEKSAKSGINASDKTIKIIRIFLQKDWPLLAKLKVGKEDLVSMKNFSDYYLEEMFDTMNVSEYQGSRA